MGEEKLWGRSRVEGFEGRDNRERIWEKRI
jgi:hypothetical protein